MLPEQLVGHRVPVVGDHLARGNGKGVGAVIPLLPCRVDDISAAAGDQGDVVQSQMIHENVAQICPFLMDHQMAVAAFFQYKDLHAAPNVGVYGEFVRVHHGEHGVQMHKAAGLGNVDGQNLLKTCFQQLLCQYLDGERLCALRNTHRSHLRTEDQNVAALQRMLQRPGIKPLYVLITGMIPENIISKESLPVSGLAVHPVQGDAAADTGEGIPGEIQVWHGINDEGIVAFQIVRQIFLAVSVDLRFPDTGHHLQHHVSGGKVHKIVHHPPDPLFAPDAGILQIVQYKLLPQIVAAKGLCGEILQIDHLYPLLCQQLGKPVMLLPCQRQIWNIVE